MPELQSARGGSLLAVFIGGLGAGPIERCVGRARWAASLDSAAAAARALDAAVFVTDAPPEGLDAAGTTLNLDGGEFHFGRRLAGLVHRYEPATVVYMGGGSAPLLSAEGFAALAQGARRNLVVTNNYYSSDVVAFPVSDGVLAAIEGVGRDNALARALTQRAGLRAEEMPRSLATLLDIDGPSDLAVLALTGEGGPRLRETLRDIPLDLSKYRAVLDVLVDPAAQLVVAGRVSSQAWQYAERETACRVRMFAEERGMEAEGRAEDGTARSLLGYYVQEAGFERFFATLAELGDAAIIDSRVLLAHARVRATREDRFRSDMGRWEAVEVPFLRELTRGAAEAQVPVLLGGHSLVSGGLMALNEYAWRRREEGKDREA